MSDKKTILRNPSDWWAKSALSAVEWREQSALYEELATKADKDGDEAHARNARSNASQCRQNARLREMGQEP